MEKRLDFSPHRTPSFNRFGVGNLMESGTFYQNRLPARQGKHQRRHLHPVVAVGFDQFVGANNGLITRNGQLTVCVRRLQSKLFEQFDGSDRAVRLLVSGVRRAHEFPALPQSEEGRQRCDQIVGVAKVNGLLRTNLANSKGAVREIESQRREKVEQELVPEGIVRPRKMADVNADVGLSLIHISEPTRPL